MTQSVVGPPGVCYDSVSGGSARGRGFVMTQSVVGPPGAGVCYENLAVLLVKNVA